VTKKEAAEKVAKLMKLARDNTCANEAVAARRQAEKIAVEHGLTQSDLETGKLAAAFDDLVDGLHKYVAQHPVAKSTDLFGASSIVKQAIDKVKAMGEVDKSQKLRTIAALVRTASFIAGDNPVVKSAKAQLDSALKNHDVTI
jgi:hypothetical protein